MSTYVFNPPTASEMEDNQEKLPYSLKRVARVPGIAIRMQRVGPRPPYGHTDTRPLRHFVLCQRSRASRNACLEQIEVHKVVTGVRLGNTVTGRPTHVEDYVHYWSDTAIVLETALEHSVRPTQTAFCSLKCLSLWSAKLVRDQMGG